MRFEKFIYKKKKEISFSPLPSSVSACRPFLPRPAHSPLPLPRSARQPPAQPRAPAARPSSRASPASRAGQPPTPPRPAADCPGPPVGTAPNLPRPRPVSRNRRRTAPAPRASWARRPLLGLVLKEPDPRAHPAALPALVFTLAKHRGTRNRRCRDLRAPPSASARNSVTEPPPLRFSPR